MKTQQIWLKNKRPIKPEDTVLLCFPFAGGGASAYYSWYDKLPEDIVVCPVQLPGREDRFKEPPYLSMDHLIEYLLPDIRQIPNNLILFGHSMGAKIAYEVEKRLEQEGKTSLHLIVSGNRPPHMPEPKPIHHLDDEAFRHALARFEGTPKEILENQDLFQFFLPMLRADFQMDEMYCEMEKTKLKCPILALGGEEDGEAVPEEIRLWEEYTRDTFSCRFFPGGHFFVWELEKEVLEIIRQNLLIQVEESYI